MNGFDIWVDDVHNAMLAGVHMVVFDVRGAADYRREHIPGAINVLCDRVLNEARRRGIAKQGFIVVYCTNGGKAKRAVQRLRDNGYMNSWDMGDIADWPYELVHG